jgi:serine/threonine protein phosphatase PrpC
LVVRAVLRTDVGRVRSENQDFGTFTSTADEKGKMPGGRLLIVADGMGGHRGGATASRLAAETVKTFYLGSGSDDIAAALREALTQANTKIFSEAQTNLDLRGMGTTTSALVVRGSQAWFAHVGDSRIYLIRGDEIRQLTEDHSLVATMVREGLLTQKEAEHHPRRNVLQRSMGVSEQVDIDVVGPFEVKEFDTFILCSDGLHGLVPPNEIKELVLMRPIDEAADSLVERSLERGAPDNVTVIVARVERDDYDDDDTIVDKDGAHRDPFDETVLDKSDIRATAADPVVEPVAAPEAPPEPSRAPQPAPKRSSTLVKWTLIFVLVLGAAGAWLFFNQQQMFQTQKSSSSR